MQNLSLLFSRRWRSTLCSIAVALAALTALPNIASAQKDSSATCADILEQSIECKPGSNAYEWCFSFRNRTNATITQVRVGNSTVNVQPVQPNGTGHACVVVTGNQGATISVTVAFCRTIIVHDSIRTPNGGWIDSTTTRLECCEKRVTLRLPTCPPDSTKACTEILEQSIKCQVVANGSISYQWCFTFRNHTNFTVTQVRVGNSVVNVQPVQPNGTREVCLTLYGSPGATTVTVMFCHEVITKDSVRGPNGGVIDTVTSRIECCEQRVNLTLPQCQNDDCIRIVEQEAYCDSTGQGRYIWCFTFMNTTNFPINTIYVGNSAVNVGSIPPGGTGRACVPLTGVPGVVSLGVRACSSRDSAFGGQNDTIREQHCCDLKVEVRLPECEPVHRDCCDGFIINFANATPVAAPNGLTGLLGLVGAGPNPIAKVSATIVSATVNG